MCNWSERPPHRRAGAAFPGVAFGGFKQSGLGRELGQEGLEAFQETKHVHMETLIERKEWWYPYGPA